MRGFGRNVFGLPAFVAVAVGCGGGGGGGDPVDVAAALARLEAEGELPALDRSRSVAGDDFDGDGVRDDVEAFVRGLGDDPSRDGLLLALARALQAATALGDAEGDVAALRAAAVAIADASQCVREAYAGALGDERVAAVRDVTANTKERFLAYVAFSAATSGLATRLAPGGACGAALPARVATAAGGGTSATGTSLCDHRGYVVAFFNGVWNTPTDDGAYGGLAALRALVGDTYDGEPVRYELFYNHTGSTVDATMFQDLAETFIQRAAEIDASGELSQRFEFLWAVLSDGQASFWDRLTDAVPAAALLLEQLYQDFATRAAAGWALMLSSPPTGVDAAEHRARLDALALEGQKILMVAHSQGNLFANLAYDHVAPRLGAASVKVVHVAPASPTLRGAYVLGDSDVVINGLRVQGTTSVPSSNLDVPVSRRDLSGHKLIETYLDPARPAKSVVAGLVSSAMASLETPSAAASQGFFTVTLTWDGSGDVDLHTFEPSGSHVFYSARAGTSGHLDVDNVTANGPEHYFASCDPAVLATGSYTIGINNYAGATGRTATVQVATVHGGVLLTRTLGVGPVRGSGGNGSPITVATVAVTKEADGSYTATAR